MLPHQHDPEFRPVHPARKPVRSAGPGFKPVALRAVAAAVQPGRQAPPRKPSLQDWPAFLRDEAFGG